MSLIQLKQLGSFVSRILCPHFSTNPFGTDTHRQLGFTNGALFAVPIPEKYEAAGAPIQEAVELAVRESEESGVSKRGKEVTPWLLNRVGELTQGTSLESSRLFYFLWVLHK